MKTLLAACIVAFGLVSLSHSQTCACRARDPSEVCSQISSVGGGLCAVAPHGCRGCVCDEAGDLTCEIVERPGFIVDPSQGVGSSRACTSGTVLSARCPAGATALTLGKVARIEIKTLCSAVSSSGIFNPPFQCRLRCFPPRYGTLVNIKARFDSTISGNYVADSADGINQSHIVQEVTHKDNGETPFSANLDLKPQLSGNTGSLQAVRSVPFTDVSDSENNYICSGSDIAETFLISAAGAFTPSVGRFQFTGVHSLLLEVQYTFDTRNASVIEEAQQVWVQPLA